MGGSTDYGNFYDFCRDSTIPICNLYAQSTVKGGPGFGQGNGHCVLTGISLGNGRYLRNLGVILLDGLSILVTLGLLFATQRRKAAVGRREIQLFLLGYILICVCEIFTIGGFPLESKIRIAFTGIHLGAITATTWMLMINGAVGYQAIDDGSFLSVFLLFSSTAALFIGTGYIALDTGYNWSGFWNTAIVQMNPDRQYSLYTLYLLCPLVFLFIYFWLEFFLVVLILRERKPLTFLFIAVILFAAGQVFTFLVSVHICHGTNGAIDGSFFETLFNLLAVIMVWIFWTSITEQDWPDLAPGEQSESYMT